jgi:pimeloyl-ACP methyl ester carboxylesterase
MRATRTAVLAVLVALVGSLVALTPSSAQAHRAHEASGERVAPIAWGRCADRDLRKAGADCGLLTVPLDHSTPNGPTIQIAVSRVLHRGSTYRGAVFVNPGGPGGSGLSLATLGQDVPGKVGRSYDWYGFDPRGVGSSEPALSCDPRYDDTEHVPYEPRTPELLAYWRSEVETYAAACGTSAARELLPHMRTTDTVADLEDLRAAIGQAQITWYGLSYGTYLGQVYATLHPTSVKAMVLDGVIDASRVWYRSNLDQDYAFAKVYSRFFRWVGRYHRLYGLGRTGQQVESRIAKARRALARKPLDKRVGAGDLEDLLLFAGYDNRSWPGVATLLRELVVEKKSGRVARLLRVPKAPDADNGTAAYLATECTDAPWPTDLGVWLSDAAIVEQDAPYLAWLNTWFNAPCRTWPAPAGTPVAVSGAAYAGPVLLTAETYDGATPFAGALATRRLFPTSALVEGEGGTSHAVSLTGGRCLDRTIARFLADGSLPSRKAGDRSDKQCPGMRPPVPEEQSDRLLPRLGVRR